MAVNIIYTAIFFKFNTKNMKKILLFSICVFFALKLSAQTKIEEIKLTSGKTIIIYNDGTWKEKPKPIVYGKITDARDSKNYKTIKIGTQTWMAENLAYKASSACWAYDNNATNVTKYGYLYDWETAKKVCLSGWHLPSDAEWTTLTNNLGGEDVAGKKMKSTSGWNDYDGESGNGTNTIGFSALPGGYRYGNEPFDLMGDYGYWWSSTEYSASNAYYRYMHGSSNNVIRDNYGKTDGISVRCVRDF